MTNQDIVKNSQQFDKTDNENIKSNGVVFTPKFIADKIISNLNPTIHDKMCEPSVGKGIFVFSLLEYLLENNTVEDVVKFVENKLYCYDINNEFISELKSNIKTYFSNIGYVNEIFLSNIKTQDFLNTSEKYDIIIGNPPYVKIHNIDKEQLDELKSKYKSLSNGNIDLYYAFVEKSMNDSKRVSLIIPNTFIKNKSGKILREILFDRIYEIFDFKTEKVWSEISTYTCIVTIEENKQDFIIYNDNKYVKLLDNDKWLFSNDDNIKNNHLDDLINYSCIGIQTSGDKYFIIKNYDEKFGFINNNKIELGICKKIIKATKTRDFSLHFYIIYPYNDDNTTMTEDFIKINFPNCYDYLLSIKHELIKRNLNHDNWYAYGRNQGLIREKIGTQLILPNTFLKSRNIHFIEIPNNDECLVLNGILVDTNDVNLFTEIIKTDEFLNYLENTNKTLPDKKGSIDVWLFLTSNSLKEYLY